MPKTSKDANNQAGEYPSVLRFCRTFICQVAWNWLTPIRSNQSISLVGALRFCSVPLCVFKFVALFAVFNLKITDNPLHYAFLAKMRQGHCSSSLRQRCNNKYKDFCQYLYLRYLGHCMPQNRGCIYSFNCLRACCAKTAGSSYLLSLLQWFPRKAKWRVIHSLVVQRQALGHSV